MSAVSTSNTPLQYRGYHSLYTDVAARGADEYLGVAIEYAVHPSGVGCFIFRFVVHGSGVKPQNYTHLMYREPAKFIVAGTETTSAEVIKGVRLNKVAIPLFKPAVQKYEVDAFAEKLNLWPLVTEWVAEQITAEGFTLLVADLQTALRAMVTEPQTPVESVTSVIEFPDLKAPEQQAAALKLVKKPVVETDEDEDLTEHEEEDDDKEWLN